MSYSNAGEYAGDVTGKQNPMGEQYGGNQYNTAPQFDNTNTSNTTGGPHFGSSGDPNTFTTAGGDTNYGRDGGNTGGMTTIPGHHHRPTHDPEYDGEGARNATGGGLGGPTRNDQGSTVNSNNFGASGMGGAGNRQGGSANVSGGGGYGSTGLGNNDLDVGGSDAYGTNNNNNNTGTNMGGAGQGFGAGTGDSGFTNTGADMNAGNNAYGNYSSDVGGQAPPVGMRGGKNDPGYQPGTKYSYDQRGYVDDNEGNNDGNNNGGKVGLGDKIKGTMQQVQGKLTKNPDLVQEGQARKTGNLNNDNDFSSGNTGDQYDSQTNTNMNAGLGGQGQGQYGNMGNSAPGNTGTQDAGDIGYGSAGNTGNQYGSGNDNL